MFYLQNLQLSPYKWKYSDLGILKNDNERTLTQSLPNEHLNNIVYHFTLNCYRENFISPSLQILLCIHWYLLKVNKSKMRLYLKHYEIYEKTCDGKFA